MNWLKIGDVKETDKFFTHAAERIKRSGIPKTREVQVGDLILSNSMSFGRAFITLIEGCIHDGWLRLRCDEERLDKEYLYYFLTSSLAQNQFKAVATGSVVNNLKSDTVKAVRIDLPPLKEQRKIATVLSTIDDKIKCNEEINENLEEQARAIFAAFISDHQTTTVTVEDIVLTANTGADAIRKAPIVDRDTGVRCVRVGDMSNQRPVHEWGFAQVTPEIFKQYQLHKDDIVVTRTASLGLNRLIGET